MSPTSAAAINEQRFAANVKAVVATDEFGAVAAGNVTGFLRYMPGPTVDLSGGHARFVSIDGAPPANTPVTLGGLNLPGSGNNHTHRAVARSSRSRTRGLQTGNRFG